VGQSGGKWTGVIKKQVQCEVNRLFYGEFQHTIDQKGRLIIPASFREELGSVFMVAKGLFIFSMPKWNSLVEKLETLPLSNTKAREFSRFFFSSAAQCKLDTHARILVPTDLRAHAGLEKDVTIVGVGNRVEVWSRDKWETYLGGESLSPESLSDTFAMLGI
jgi:MraZ protein